ncbi:hypothetical protein D7Y41_33020 [Anaerotruncus sp. 1XD22-93]|nr:hypothetical protein [Lachnospiraceae bacterium]NBI77102.1 hypothetical protein [Lachnospiraceae bacterium]RKJ75585.1 hypothetical protein D7Y41_33020 [Anaerotruncus sp. 1XD22-93]
MAGSTDYKNKWQAENRERINMVVPKGYKEKIKTVAQKTGESVNGYIKKAVDMRMQRDTGNTLADATPQQPQGKPAPPESESTKGKAGQETPPVSVPSTPEPVRKRGHAPLTKENIAKINLHQLLTDIRYQFDVRDAFGADALGELLKYAREQNTQHTE